MPCPLQLQLRLRSQEQTKIDVICQTVLPVEGGRVRHLLLQQQS